MAIQYRMPNKVAGIDVKYTAQSPGFHDVDVTESYHRYYAGESVNDSYTFIPVGKGNPEDFKVVFIKDD